MTARTHNHTVLARVQAHELHMYDRIVGTQDTLTVREVSYRACMVTLRVTDGVESWNTYTVERDRMVTVHAEHECQCGGSGAHYGRGYVENGVFKGTIGVCYGCHGKGWQTRADVIRNHVYWSKYAHVYAYA